MFEVESLPTGWIVFENAEELWSLVRSRGEYTAVKRVWLKKSSGEAVRVYIAKPFNEVCWLQDYLPGRKLHHYDLEVVGRVIIRLIRDKMSFERLMGEYRSQWIGEALEEVEREREKLIDRIYEAFQNHPVSQWASCVKGLGKMYTVMFICMIDPHIASTSGKACAYWGLAGPRSVLRRGEKTVGHRVLRGIAYFMASRVAYILRDPYYYPLFMAKKEWCLRKCQEKGEKGYRAHADKMARLWLAHLLVSHAWEKYREFERLPIHPHRLHIPPKPTEDATWTDEKVLECLRNGRLE
jgi:hypothetical protein